MANVELDEASLVDLIDRLEGLDGRRTPVGWTPEDATMRTAIERRVIERLTGPLSDEDRVAAERLPLDLSLRVRSKHDQVRGVSRDIGPGGVFVRTAKLFRLGTPVYLEISGHAGNERGVRVRGTVSWTEDAGDERGMGVSIDPQHEEAKERRIRRFVIEALRHRVM